MMMMVGYLVKSLLVVFEVHRAAVQHASHRVSHYKGNPASQLIATGPEGVM